MEKQRISNLKVDPRNARAEGYKKIMSEMIADGSCPLCPPMKWHPNPILQEHDKGRWIITANSHPYEHATHHLLIIPKRHIELLSDLSVRDLKSIFALANWAAKEFNIKGGGLTMRFGETLYTGATIKHLHTHLIVPTAEGDKVKPVYFPIG